MGSTRTRRTKDAAEKQHSPEEIKEEKMASEPEAEKTSDRCPQCPEDEENPEKAIAKEDWVRCDACKVWFHWRCVGEGGDLEHIDKWFCKPCIAADPKRTITNKPPARKSSRKRPTRDYATLHNGVPTGGADKWSRLLDIKEKAGAFSENPFPRMKGQDLTIDWADTNPEALLEPVLIESPEGLGMEMPSSDTTVTDIARIIGEDTPLEVMDVATQSNTPGFTLGKWAAYVETPSDARDRIRNVISLEISDSVLGKQVVPPRIVRDLDWVEKYWPSTRKGPGHAYPKVQLYCLMGVAKAWTDWHVDFAGSSVYYHILKGAKVFFFIRPTPANLAQYERWSGSEMQTTTWLGDLCDEVYKVELKAGNTMLIPTGWIHSVYTPEDTIVFGGNFLHSYNIATQLHVREIENATRVPKKFQFPYFTKLCWYVGEATCKALKAREEYSTRVLQSLNALARFLVSEARHIEQGKSARDNVPADKVKDAPALARELRWRVKMALNGASDGEDDSPAPGRGHARKRRRETVEVEASGEEARNAKFKNFTPKRWDACEVRTDPIERIPKSLPAGLSAPPADMGPSIEVSDWAKTWLQFDAESASSLNGTAEKSEGMELDLESVAALPEVEGKREVMIRVRRTEKGLERQRIERIVENWDWDALDKRKEGAQDD